MDVFFKVGFRNVGLRNITPFFVLLEKLSIIIAILVRQMSTLDNNFVSFLQFRPFRKRILIADNS